MFQMLLNGKEFILPIRIGKRKENTIFIAANLNGGEKGVAGLQNQKTDGPCMKVRHVRVVSIDGADVQSNVTIENSN